MQPILLLVLSIFFLPEYSGAVECESGWAAYKDELCIQAFPNVLTYDEAKEFCTSQGNEMSKSSLVLVKEEDLQELLVAYTQDIFDNLWLGGRYNEEAEQFLWDDGDALTYTNWQEGAPRNNSDGNICIEMKPINAKASTNAEGKWTDVNCQKRNGVMCQRTPSWSLQDAISEIIKMRKELEEVKSTVVPVGSIYIEYYNQPNPGTLWPTLTWEDISNTFAGLFFRVSGGGAANWGSNQAGCAPRITRMYNPGGTQNASYFSGTIAIPENGVSEYGLTGWHAPLVGDQYRLHSGVQFTTEGCEVRPPNQAVRIWKRIG